MQTYVTGVGPAQVRQAEALQSRLHVFEVLTLVLIAVIVGVVFRSPVAPLVVLVTAGLGYLVAIRSLGLAAAAFGFALPDQLQPLIAALLIGVITDYCVLFFSGMRRQLGRGLPRLEAARAAVTTTAHIVAVAGLTVAAGTAALLAADFELFRAFGPALSLTVVIGVLVSLTLVPALMAVLGSWLFGVGGGRLPTSRPPAGAGWVLRSVVHRRGAAVATALSVGVLLLAALPVLHLRLDLSFTSALADDDPVRAGRGGAAGGRCPRRRRAHRGAGRGRRRRGASARPCAGCRTPSPTSPGWPTCWAPSRTRCRTRYGVVFSADGDTARFVVILDSDPLAAPAVRDLRRLAARLDDLAAQAGVVDADVAVTGQTAVAAELAVITRENLRTTLLAVLAVELLILVGYLRALLAPVVLLATSALGVAAALGLTVLVFQDLLGDPGLTFYVPFATAVLLLALGADYNVFAVGSIWDAAARLPLARAIAVAMPSHLPGDQRGRGDPGGDVRDGGDHPAGDVPPDSPSPWPSGC